MLKMFGDVRLTKDAVVKEVSGGKMVGNVTVANNRGAGDNKQTDFVDLVGWDNVAIAMQDLKKGQMVNIIGSYQERSWVDKEGKTHKNTEIVLDSITLANVRKKDGETSTNNVSAAPAAEKKTTNKKAAPVQTSSDEFEELGEDGELPF